MRLPPLVTRSRVTQPRKPKDHKPLWEELAEKSRAMPEGERLQKVLARAGIGSRRKCEELISEGRVSVNGETAVLGRRVDIDGDSVEIDGVPIGVRPDTVYYLLNKPVGVVCSAADEMGRLQVTELVPAEPRVFSVGRLDIDSEGLLILTNDGELANRIMHPRHHLEKEYMVEVALKRNSTVPPVALKTLRQGVLLDDGLTAPAKVTQLSPGVLRITIHEGRNRQVRRMCDAIGYPVTRLVRTRIGPIVDRKIAPGHWRKLTDRELRLIIAAVTEPEAQ